MQTIFNSGANQQPAIPGKTYIRMELVDGSIAMPPEPYRILIYMLAQPQDWILNIERIKHTLGLSTHSVKKSLKWLQKAGYVRHERKKTGHTQWFVYDIAQKTGEDIDKTTQ